MEERIKWLNTLKEITTIQALLSKFELTPENKINLWRNILILLKSEESPIIIDEENGSESDDQIEALLTFITQNSDIEDKIEDKKLLYSKLYEAVKNLIDEQSEDTFWNESVQKLIQYFINQMDGGEIIDDKIILPVGEDWETNNKSIKIFTLKYLLDAGFNFPIEKRDIGNTWISPLYNIDGESYDEVRKHDEIIDILKDDNKLQYTKNYINNEVITNWLRLLMPQYGRRTEIEDLNRNFWVITQTIAAISNYLFNNDNPILKTLNGMLREITEIWENILYLWTNFAAITQENLLKNTEIIHIPLPPRQNEYGRKYDKIDKSDIDEEGNIFCDFNIDEKGNISIISSGNIYEKVLTRLSLLPKIYSGKNLCIIPYIRLKNYKHNYYEIEYYPGAYYYSIQTQDWKYTPFSGGVKGREDMAFSVNYNLPGDTSFEGQRCVDKIYGTNQQYNSKIAYIYPYTKEIEQQNGIQIYGAIRIIPEVEISQDNEGYPIIKNITFKINDAAYNLINGNTYNKTIFELKGDQEGNYLFFKLFEPNNEEQIEEIDLSFKNYNSDFSGYYLGEVASTRRRI